MSNLKEQLIGTTWSLVSYESIDANGAQYFPLGEDAKGYIVFDKTGLFSVQIMASERSKTLTETELTLFQNEVEKRIAEYGYHAYSGRYAIDEGRAVMKTSVELSLIEDYIGSEQQRSVMIEDNHLYLTNVEHPERKLIWKKIANEVGE